MTRLLSFLLVIVICLASILTGCSQSTARALSPEEQSLVQSGNAFGFNLFKEAVTQEQDKNIFISPLSVAMALGMTLNGANGDTRQAMESTLALSGLTEEEINKSYKSLIELLRGLDPAVKFQLANSIWFRQEMSFEKEFLDQARTYFDAGIEGLDFDDPHSIDVINSWVKDNTNGKIEEIVDETDLRAAVMFLINAIYFKGNWTYQFDKYMTRDDSFTLLDGTQKAIKMMNQKTEFRYFENSDFQAVDLPYGKGDYSMTIFLPREGKDLDSLISDFSEDNWATWSNSFSKKEVSLQLPKFTLEYDLELNDVLKALGMSIAFDPDRSDFTKMSIDSELYIGKVMHKTFIEVNEEGTEAAAVTSVRMDDEAVGGFMRVDRPFVFVIHENQSQTLLFMGKIVDPA